MDTNIQVPIRIDKDGVWRVGNTRVPIDTVLTAYHQGAVPEEIRAKIERNSDVAEIRARLLARQAARNQSDDATSR